MSSKLQIQVIDAAKKVRARAYAPYSNYKVGCAVLSEDGEIFAGCNVENASYRLVTCAESNALGAAVAAGKNKFRQIAIVTKDGGTPCGACRQIIWELCGNVEVLVIDDKDTITKYTGKKLLPDAFELKG